MELSSHRPVRRIPTQIKTQIPSYLSSRKDFSVASQKNAPQGSGATGKPSEPESNLSKAVIGSVALGAAVIIAYQTGYLDRFLVKEQQVGTADKDHQGLTENNQELRDGEYLKDKIPVPNFQETNSTNSSGEPALKTNENSSDITHLDILKKSEGENDLQSKVASGLTPQNDTTPVQKSKLAGSAQSSETSDNESTKDVTVTQVEENLHTKIPEVKPIEQHETVESASLLTQANAVPKQNEMKSRPLQHHIPKITPKDTSGNDMKQSSTLLDEYYLQDKTEEASAASSYEHMDLDGAAKDSNGFYITKDGQLVLNDFLQAIHAAEKRQAELDAHKYGEEKRIMKEKFEKVLRDARARELMYAEREAILDKELNKEKVKAAAALKSLQEKLEEKLKMELEQKEAEAALELKIMQELGKAELASAVASEKASHIEKMAEANLNINALCMAFYARSEEARQSHCVYKLALGTLAIEDALSKGLPIQKEINALHTYLEGIDKGSLLDLVLSSLPEETRNTGTDTLLQLNHKFDALKGTLRHFSLIPPGGGGIFVHSLAHVASLLKVREDDESGDGIESVINRVESLLAKGKLSEAADTLEDGLKGSQAAEIVTEWVKQARNRAITEQALTLLQSYATTVSLT